MHKYGLMILLVTLAGMLIINIDKIILGCMAITIIEQMSVNFLSEEMTTILDIACRFVIDCLVIFKLSKDMHTLSNYLSIRFVASALEFIILISDNPIFTIYYFIFYAYCFYIWYTLVIGMDHLSSLILFRFPIFVLGMVPGTDRRLVITSSNIINKGLYLLALNLACITC